MRIVVPPETTLVQRYDLLGRGSAAPLKFDARIWINSELTDQELGNLALVERMWTAWKAIPVDLDAVRDCLHPEVYIRTGWRGDHLIEGRDEAMAVYREEVQRQTAHDEVTDIRFPIVVAKGPTVFHTWIWIASSARLGYHIERPMTASYLITDGLIERWDIYCTGGPESEPGYIGGAGPDGL